MPPSNIAAMDLNLLKALDVLLTERHVSRAAARLGTSQPSLSRALAQLRLWFKDPLLVRTRHGMTPTSRALVLAGEVRAVLERIDGLMDSRLAFEPATSRRVFRISTAEYAQCLLFPPLLERLHRLAPRLSVKLSPWSLRFPEELEDGTLDLALGPTGELPAGLRSEAVLSDRFACVLRAGHPAADRPLTLERFVQLSHIQVAPSGRDGGFLDDLLAEQGLSRHITLRLPGFAVVASLVAASDLCATLPELLVSRFTQDGTLVAQPPPVELPGIQLRVSWHERAHLDPGLEWLRGQLREAAVGLKSVPPKRTARLDLRRRTRHTL